MQRKTARGISIFFYALFYDGFVSAITRIHGEIRELNSKGKIRIFQICNSQPIIFFNVPELEALEFYVTVVKKIVEPP